MDRTLTLLLASSLMNATLFAQDDVDKASRDAAAKAMTEQGLPDSTGKIWMHGGVFQLNFNQVELVNWSAGGISSISGVGLFTAFANRRVGRTAWDNSVALAYGLIAEKDTRSRKTDDRWELNSKYGYQLKGPWYLSGFVQARSQFTEGFDAANDTLLISNFMSPGYLLFGLGFDYKPSDHFNAFLSPATVKMVIVQDQDLADAGIFGNDPAEYDTAGVKIKDGENTDVQFGGYISMVYKNDIATNVAFMTRLELFSNYLREPENVDVNWEMLFTFKVNDWLAATLNTILVYDHDISVVRTEDEVLKAGPVTQFKETFGLGLTVKF